MGRFRVRLGRAARGAGGGESSSQRLGGGTGRRGSGLGRGGCTGAGRRDLVWTSFMGGRHRTTVQDRGTGVADTIGTSMRFGDGLTHELCDGKFCAYL